MPTKKGTKFSKKHRNSISIGIKNHLPRTSFKKGEHPNIKNEFKKGMIPWNKNRKCPEISGKNHPNWKGGLWKGKPYKAIRNSDVYKKWRTDVFERDNWTCQTCQKRGIYLQVHHIKPFISIVQKFNIKTIVQAFKCKELWDIDNGVTLCYDCHQLTKRRNKK